ncbi:Fanconi anemia group B protein [Callorhinchus milii]|uniref:Fanconi anemia group B protein n=1 Tax=Callorhinchus milii TaxID=7868 RepID=UPI001C3FDC96|nr:Fanconi anemia group B protein [Callorhinchus milii]XP_042189864.1 Fanconi anemia group B protein [Callorhinchus milii]XP_042189865.1 Fanconi anemia group B protein [Callorhinchus milii]XP_042189866.1 Fanconi anemia group B protein [Callorhinchus milii]XP_042189867.1 Fanconi anemia group B protein [Callorhinchus milii]XP_042189868.1 Fanconi anemia group B protein [Callorhinchus milii]XP_042189869.1 Fanconi anemia group B protein [Callorhinchus milii]XP_042189870.1 Fanconi anemia group B p
MESIIKSENVVTLSGKMISFALAKERATGGKSNTVLHFRRMTFDSHNGKIVQTFAGQSSARGKSYFSEIIVCCCTTDSRTGETVPCILLKMHRKGSATFGYVLLILHNSNELEYHLDFELENELKETVRLLPGPSVFWSSDDSVYYVSFETAAIVTITVSFTSVKWIGEVDSDIILLGSRKISRPITMEEKYSTSDELVWGSEFVGYSLKKKESLRGDQFIPHAYSSVVTNMFLCSIEEIDNQWKSTVVASTRKGQLILFENGVPKDVCQLPFEEANEIKMGTTGGENCLFLVSSRAGSICAVSKESWQVVASWQAAWSVHLDDFLGTGSDQILLLSMTSSSPDACLKDFILTDLCEFNYTTDSGHPEDRPQILNQATHEQYHHTIQALEARLQSGLAALHELQDLLADKERVLLQCSKALINLVEGNPCILPEAEEEGLVSLWDEEETDLQPLEEETNSTTQVLNHPMQRVWQRVVDDSWVVGVQLSESVGVTFDFVSLFLVMDQDLLNTPPVIESHSNVLKLSKSVVPTQSPTQYPAEPPLKKLKLDLQGMKHVNSIHKDLCPSIHKDHLRIVTAVTKLSPLLMYNNVQCSVLLYGIKGPSQETELTKREIILPCGSVSLNLEGIWNEKYIVQLLQNPQVHSDKAEEDFFTIMTTFQRASFSIFSPEYTLAHVKEWLLGPMQCEPLKIYPEYLLCPRWGALYVLFLNWNLQNQFKGTLTVLYRNQTHLLRCLHSLIRVLPQACTIVHMSLGCEDQMTDALGVALEKEAHVMQNIITSAISEAENEFTMRAKTKKKLSNPRLDSEEKLQLYREKFQMEQEQSFLGMNLTINNGLYRKITQKLIDMQQDTDNSAWRLSVFHRAFAKTLVNL